MRVLLFWTLLSFAASLIAWNKGRSPGLFFFLSMVFSPVLGLLGAILIPAKSVRPRNHTIVYRNCPRCGAAASMDTSRCARCGATLPPIIDATPST